ncbi:hypothetical protein [Chromobacterium amazonense]|uniref:hypothetical protein n=1 Tax=Chromobacterium amazonense TaxID=1382803 RepID=UPI003F7A960B
MTVYINEGAAATISGLFVRGQDVSGLYRNGSTANLSPPSIAWLNYFPVEQTQIPATLSQLMRPYQPLPRSRRRDISPVDTVRRRPGLAALATQRHCWHTDFFAGQSAGGAILV